MASRARADHVDHVMTRRQALVFAVITAAVATAGGVFTAAWVDGRGAGAGGAAWLVLTLVLGYHFATWLARWIALPRMRRPRAVSPEAGLRVAVATTFVPGGEPIAMLEQTVRAMVALEYPHDTWVLDEGDDPAVRELCASAGARHFSRIGAPRYQTPAGPFAARTKHGNYNAWLDAIAYDRYDVVVNLDSDHVPEPHFLIAVLGHFRDPDVGYVQAPQCYYNQEASFIARGAAEETYAYHSIHQMASFGIGETTIVGCHGTHRVRALREVGGYPAHDAEDLLLTARYRAAGWRGVYVPEILALGTTAVDWVGYLGQQLRWARSTLDVKIRAYRESAGRLPLLSRLLLLLHGSYYLRPLTVPLVYAVVLALLLTGADPGIFTARITLWGAAVAALLLVAERFRRQFFLDPQREGGLHWRAALLQLAKWPIFLVAIWDVLSRRQRPYALTVKTAGARHRTGAHWPHVLVAALTTLAWLGGTLVHGKLTSGVTVAAVALVVVSVGIAATQSFRFPPPFEQGRYARRRAEIGRLLQARGSG